MNNRPTFKFMIQKRNREYSDGVVIDIVISVTIK